MSAPPKILVTNDEGYGSIGIIEVAEALQAVGDVTVVAPEADMIGVGHSISIKYPVKVAQVRDRTVRTYRCSGTPADCIVIGAFVAGAKYMAMSTAAAIAAPPRPIRYSHRCSICW